MYVIIQLCVIYVAVILLFPLVNIYVLILMIEGLIDLSRNRLICFIFDTDVKSSREAAHNYL